MPSVKIANVCLIIESWGCSEPIRRASFVFLLKLMLFYLLYAFFPHLRNVICFGMHDVQELHSYSA